MVDTRRRGAILVFKWPKEISRSPTTGIHMQEIPDKEGFISRDNEDPLR